MSENTNNKKAVAYAWSRYYNEVDRNMDLHRKYCEIVNGFNSELYLGILIYIYISKTI
jgi:hypothetical protein